MNLDPLFSFFMFIIIQLTYVLFLILFIYLHSVRYILEPNALSDPSPLSISLSGWASWELRLTFQLHFDLWPCCCGLLHLGHNSTCHSPTFHPLCSASHPPITTLPFSSSLFPLSGTYQGYIGYSQSTHTLFTFSGERWKKGGDAESAIEKHSVGVLHPRRMRMIVLMVSVSLAGGNQFKHRDQHNSSNVRTVCVRQSHTNVNTYLFDYFAWIPFMYVLIASVY